MRFIAIFVLCLLPTGAFAQAGAGDRLADIRKDLETLDGMISGLRLELQQSGGADSGIVNAAPVLERIQLLEAEMVRVTGEVEKLRFRLDRVVADGTNRVDDLKFRLTELEGGSLSGISDTPQLGTQDATPSTPPASAGGSAVPVDGTVRPRLRTGDAASTPATGFDTTAGTTPITDPAPVTPVVPVPETGPELAISEREAFDRAKAAFDAGDNTNAAALFAKFLMDFPGGPLTDEAMFLRGEAFARSGDWASATRAYLDTFSGAPQGARAAEALYNVGRSLGQLGRTAEACQTLQEVFNRYPDASQDVVARVNADRQTLGCS